jgi:sigma-B regulation protein RsbQ
VRDLLPRLTVPTALIHSTADVAVPPAVGRYLNAQIAGSELLWIDVEGHLPHLSDPPSVRGALAQLLDR